MGVQQRIYNYNEWPQLQVKTKNGNIMEIDKKSIEYVAELPATCALLPKHKQAELKEKWAELKDFYDKNYKNAWNKTVEDLYDSDKLRKQLFNLSKQEKKVL